ncbi:Ankyrin repeat domain-containing protein 50-like protein 3 [Colletotrichum musicola]|uniref:Ankyrin repeat domain-containing protein 50-like protein 3 n=1 Tax=Colletotrichum musicola TaxID=2175873 RepID=A0A8H6K6V5_9PEZI|nr:Ankyrin repeat domain-containing protein 50-like protein 3 [Colletotrichum musicola]
MLVSDTNAIVSEHSRKQELRYENEKHAECHRVFKTSRYQVFKDNNPERVQGTCEWVLGHERYRRWYNNSGNDLLWISADPGCGKSVLAKSLIDNELRNTDSHNICYFFFKDNEEQNSFATAMCTRSSSSAPSAVFPPGLLHSTRHGILREEWR